MSFCVRSIKIFSKFSGDPYYEPLSWFMILKLWLGIIIRSVLIMKQMQNHFYTKISIM